MAKEHYSYVKQGNNITHGGPYTTLTVAKELRLLSKYVGTFEEVDKGIDSLVPEDPITLGWD